MSMIHVRRRSCNRYIQSGRRGVMCGILFTSNLGEIRIKQNQLLHVVRHVKEPFSVKDPQRLSLSFSRSTFKWVHSQGREFKTVLMKVFTARTHPATLIILGLKASTCLSRVFMVFPVPTIACEKGEVQK